jgi:tetratricopeptide (TPR) repeat protein
MTPERHGAHGWPIAWMMGLCVAMSLIPGRAQPQRKTSPKASTSQDKQDKEDPLAPLLRQANDAIDKTDFASALDPLQKYIAQRPEDSYAHFQIGYAYAGLKRPDDAKMEFSRAIALDPNMAAAHLNLGLVLMDSDPAAAAESFRHAAELQPTEGRPRFLAGLALEHSGKLTEAAGQYRAALVLSPKDYEGNFALGRVLLLAGDAPGAEGQYRAAIAVRNDSAPARLGLAEALLGQNKYEAAVNAFDEYLKRNPGDRSAHFDRASALRNLDRYDDALSELDHVGDGSAPTADMLKMRGDIYVQQKKWKEAGDALTQAIRLSPQDAEVAALLGHVDIELRDYPAAINILVQVYKQNQKSVDALRDLINAFYLNENYSEAIGAMDQLTKLETPKPASWFVRAICYDKLSHKVEAIDAYQKFLDQDNGQHDKEDFQARHRILTLQGELGKSTKKK